MHPTTPTAPAPFNTAADVTAAHAALLAELPEDPGPEDLGPVTDFIRRAVAAGVGLDSPEERKQVQGLIDYWAASLQTEYREAVGRGGAGPVKPATTVLAEFDPARLRAAAAAADRWLADLPEADRQVARRVVLRLVRLRVAESEFDLVPATRGALHSEGASAEGVDAVIAGLVGMGVVRLTPGPTPENDQLALRSDRLLADWTALVVWLEDRVRFRGRAYQWDAERQRAARAQVGRAVDRVDRWLTRTLSTFGRTIEGWVTPPIHWLRHRSGVAAPSHLLLTGERLDDSRAFHDRNPVERQFADESRYREQLASDRNRLLMGLFGLATVVAGIGWIAAATSAVGMQRKAEEADSARQAEEREKKVAVQQKEAADQARADAEAQRADAQFNLDLADSRRAQSVKAMQRLEKTEDDLAAAIELALGGQKELETWRNGDASKRASERVQTIRNDRAAVQSLWDPSQKLRPGCRVWIDLPGEPDPFLSCVCCIVRLSGGTDDRRFAVVYYTPKGQKAAVRPTVTRSDKSAGGARATDVVGHIFDHASLRQGQSPNTTADQAVNGRIALVELAADAPADNLIPGRSQTLVGPVTGRPDLGGTYSLIGSTSGLKSIEILAVESSGFLVYKGAGTGEGKDKVGTLGDGGGPIFNDRNELIGLHMTSFKGTKKAFLIAPWLAEHGLELVPVEPK